MGTRRAGNAASCGTVPWRRLAATPADRHGMGGAGVSEQAMTDPAPGTPGRRTGPEGPIPFRQFIVKMHGRCNLACTYCYLYEGPDGSWRDRPAAASAAVLDRTATRIAEHAERHALRDLALVLHGGEPLLAGAGPLAEVTGRVRELVPRGCQVHATVQTNATLLTEERLAVLADAGIRVGISLDGGTAAHNRRRVDHAGRPSWPAAARGARLVAERFPESYAGLLTVVDPTLDPVETYESLLGLRPPALDLLLPHGNWTAPPPGRTGVRYGDWLCAVFDRWWAAGRREVRVRLFEECVALLLGLPAATEALGLAPFDAVVVETDGSIEQVDSLKSAYPGAARTGLDVFRHTFDDALRHPGVAVRQAGTASLAGECRACPLLRVCGGGHYAHRYRAGHGFRNPSVYCADLQRFIRHVSSRLTAAAGGPTPGGPAASGLPGGGSAANGFPEDGSAAKGPSATGPSATAPASVGLSVVGPASAGPYAVGPVPVGPSAIGPAPAGTSAAGPASTGTSAAGPASAGPAVGPAPAGPAAAGPSVSAPASAGVSVVGPASADSSTVGPAPAGPTVAAPAATAPAPAGPASAGSGASAGPASAGAASVRPVVSGSAAAGTGPAEGGAS
ncbi:FxsB family radical SAM/SPASM domain protein [Streptomyces sp. LRa12]|nr:FxsB family radical SAM/SPASM domain protein [Streptomyces sp. LRa12]